MTDQFHVCNHQQSDGLAEVKDLTAESFEAELQDVKENVRNLNLGLHSVVKRVERLEGAHFDLVDRQRQSLRNKHVSIASSEPMELGTSVDEVAHNKRPASEISTGTAAPPARRVFKSTSYQKAFYTQGSAHNGTLSKSFSIGTPTSHSFLDDLCLEPQHRTVALKKPQGSLGLTFHVNNGQVVVANITNESPLGKQGLIHVGDSIVEINGKPVRSHDEAADEMKNAHDALLFKVIPAETSSQPAAVAFVKAFFDFNPSQDKSIPCAEVGLPFKGGEVLQIINKDDQQWWLARKVYDSSRIGLVPSHSYQLSRTAPAQESHKPIVGGVNSGIATLRRRLKRKSDVEDEANGAASTEPLLYEEVGRLCPYGRRVLLLLGAQGVGRRTLKSRLLRHDPLHFATVVPFTSRAKREAEQDGREYNFVPREQMQKEIERGEFLEFGEFGGNLYGTKISSVREIVKQGKMCVLDCSPQAIRFLYSWEFMPYIVCVAPPPLEELKALYAVQLDHFKPKTEEDLVKTSEFSGKLESVYKQYFDLTLTNRNAEVTFRRLLDALETLKTQQQWVPVTWLTA